MQENKNRYKYEHSVFSLSLAIHQMFHYGYRGIQFLALLKATARTGKQYQNQAHH